MVVPVVRDERGSTFILRLLQEIRVGVRYGPVVVVLQASRLNSDGRTQHTLCAWDVAGL